MYAERITRLKSSAIREILKITGRPGMISFAGGMPAPELFPLREVAEAAQTVISKYGHMALQYSITEGFIPLRELIIAAFDGGAWKMGLENILITQGSQQGLDLIAKLFLERGSVVLTENPTYLGALQSFQLFGADIRAVPSDEGGITIEGLEHALRKARPALLYVMPTFQNPTGTCFSLERRLRLIELAREHGLLIVEDDPYSDLRYTGGRLPTLFSLGGPDHVIYLNSFSKTIAPGLRIAYAVASAETIGKLVTIKQGTDLQTNTLGQYLAHEYIRSGHFTGHLKTLCSTYAARRDTMLDAMSTEFPDTVRWNRPGGGMFIWARLPEGTNARPVLAECLTRNVAFVPGQEFFPDGSGANTMRLNFSNASPDNIREGVRRLGAVLRGAVPADAAP